MVPAGRNNVRALGVKLMQMRLAVSLLAIAAVGLSWADDSLLARDIMARSIPRIRTTGQMALSLTGTHQQGRSSTDIKATLAMWYGTDSSGRPVAKTEAMLSENGRMVTRLVGDGQYFYAFDVRTNTYSSSRYGSVDEAGQRADHLPLMCKNLRLRSGNGALTFLAKLNSDIFERPVTSWQPYVSNSTVTVSNSLADKIISAEANTPYFSRTEYRIDPEYDLTQATYHALRSLGANDIVDDFSVNVYGGELFTDTDFTFSPPAGSRATAVAESTGGL
jgi:hypothetical protein